MNQGISLFNDSMVEYLIKNKRYLLKRPSYIKTFAQISGQIKKQTDVRDEYARKEDLIIPPVLILSVTNDCNLSCKGCYACSQNRDRSREMSIDDIERVVDEAVALGVSVILIAGGEPLMKKGILNLPQKYKDILFVMFTNGLLLNGSIVKQLRSIRNLIPIISIEGNEETTDERRGKGMFSSIMKVMENLDRQKILFGASITVTSKNYDEVVQSGYFNEMELRGCRAVFLIEYVPSENDFDLCLTNIQKQDLIDQEELLSKKYHMLFVPLPGNEDKYGGCLASGRGFLHISSTGSLEACPFAPYSDTNVKDMPLKEALKSKLLKEIRDNHHMLKESRGGCALQENKQWIEALMQKNK